MQFTDRNLHLMVRVSRQWSEQTVQTVKMNDPSQKQSEVSPLNWDAINMEHHLPLEVRASRPQTKIYEYNGPNLGSHIYSAGALDNPHS